MPSTAEILQYAPASSYLAANAIAKGQMFPRNKLNPILNQQIYAVYFILNKIYTLDNSYTGVDVCAQYLWELMGRYGVAAQGLSGQGGSVPSPTPSVPVYPFIITSADFEGDGVTYINQNIVGDTISLFVNQYSQQWLVEGAETFTTNSQGFVINIPGFDANTQDWTIMVQQIFGSGGGGGSQFPEIFDETFSNIFN